MSMKAFRVTLVLAALSALVLAAGAVEGKEVGAATGVSGTQVKLYDDTAHCKDGSTMVTAKPVGQPHYTGCWFTKLGVVWIMWEDGDFSAYPSTVFKFSEI
jgi:hypothetical protein